MYINDKTTVQAIKNKYPFPQKTIEENPFAEFFQDDELTRYSRQGAQIIIMDGKARFTHKSIMEYFAARVFYEEIKFFHPKKDEDVMTTLQGYWLNEKLLKGDDVTD